MSGNWDNDFSNDFGNEEPTKKSVIVKCTDNCSCMSVDKWSDEDEYSITFYKSLEKSFWHRLKEGIRYILGDDIISTDIILDEGEYNKLRKF